MSLSNKVVKTRDPRVDLQRGSEMVLEEGARIVNFYNRSASSASSSGITFDNVDPGSTGFIVDRKFYVRGKYAVVYSPRGNVGQGTDESGRIQIRNTSSANALIDLNLVIGSLGDGISSGPRAFPLARSTRSVELTLNGETFSYKIGEYIDPLMRYDNLMNYSKIDYSMTPSMQDTSQDYLDYATGVVGGSLNPFNPYGANVNRSPRGAYSDLIPLVLTEVTAVLNTSVAVTQAGITWLFVQDGNNTFLESITLANGLDITEPVMLPILKFGSPDGRGFYGLNDMRLSLTFDANLEGKVWSGKPTNAGITTLGVSVVPSTLTTDWKFFYNVLTPKMLPELPDSNIYGDERIKINTQQLKQAGALSLVPTDPGHKGATQSIVANNISVSTVPKRIYIYAMESFSSRAVEDPDTYLALESITFDFNNQNTQFTNADKRQLYLQCRRNGLQMDYLQWSKHIGSVFCIDFARDISLDLGDYPGRIGNYNFNYTATFKYLRDTIKEITLYTVMVEEGYAVIQNQVCSRTGGLIQVDPTSVPIVHQSLDDKWAKMYGGSFVDSLKSFGHKVAKGAQKGIELGKQIYHDPRTQKVVDFGKKALPYVEKGLAMALPLLAAGGISEKEARKIIDEYGYEAGMQYMNGMIAAGSGRVGGGVKAGKSLKAKAKRGGASASTDSMKKQLSLY